MSGKDKSLDRQGRRDRFIKERIHDPYRQREKLPEPTVCPTCGVEYREGRWTWVETRSDRAHEYLCPACQRIRDGVPAGFLTLGSSDFLTEHREEIMKLVHNREKAEKTRRPMSRLMDVTTDDDGQTVITFTDNHLPASIGRAIRHAFKGELDFHYTDEGDIVRVWWKRNESNSHR